MRPNGRLISQKVDFFGGHYKATWKAGLQGLRPGSLCCLGDNLFLSFSLLLHRSLPPPNCPRPPAPQRRSPSRKGVVSKAHRQWFLDTPSATPPLSQGMMRLRFAEASGSLSWAEPRRALPLGLFSPRSRAERTGGSHATTDTMDGWMRAQTEGPPPTLALVRWRRPRP